MVTAQVQTYQEASRFRLAQGRDDLERGDLRHASINGWDATVLMLVAVAEQHGWEHQGYRLIRRVASQLADETGDVEIRRLYRVAHSLHINFYEDLDTAEDVAAGLEDVQRLLDKLEAPVGRAQRYWINLDPKPKSDTKVVHREGHCPDVRKNAGQGQWKCVGYFLTPTEAVAQATAKFGCKARICCSSFGDCYATEAQPS